jgi:hypothetical protein
MSRKERVLAGLLLAIAVAGGALIPRLLASPLNPLGIALGAGPGRSVVQAPAISTAPHRRPPSPRTSSTSSAGSVQVNQVIARTTPASAAAPVKHTAPPPSSGPTPAPSPAPTPTPAPSPAPPPTPPPVVIHATAVVVHSTPPGQAKKGLIQKRTPPGQEKKIEADHEDATPSAQVPTTAAKTHGSHGQRKGAHNLEGSGNGRPASQAPSHPVGPGHRRVGHLATPPQAAAAAAHQARPKARPQDRGPRGDGGAQPSEVTDDQTAHGNANGHDK